MVSVVIPTFNEENYIGKLLECLKKQTYRDFEIIVADNKSPDKTAQIARSYGARVVPGGHQAFGRNNGVKNAKGEVILFLDADVKFDKNFLEDSYKEFTERKADIACCYFETKGFSLELRILYELWNSSKYVRRGTALPDGEGQCIWIKKSAFEKIKGFNENLKIAEDVDLIHRALESGFHYEVLPTKFVPSSRRYKKVTPARVMLGSFIGGVEQLLGKKTTGRYAELIYGGWGKNDKKKSS